MPLKLRPTGLGHGVDKDRPDYKVFTGEWESAASTSRDGPDEVRLFWSLPVVVLMIARIPW